MCLKKELSTQINLSTRESSTLAAVLSAISSSLGLVGTDSHPLLAFIVGFSLALFSVVYRELTIWQTSREGNMRKQRAYPAKKIRLVRSFSFRVFIIAPTALWVWIYLKHFGWATPECHAVVLIVSAMIIFLISFILTLNEECNLWIF